jgi:hypothetical protein
MVHSHRPTSLASGAIASSHGGQSVGLPSFRVASEPVRENGACPIDMDSPRICALPVPDIRKGG